MIKIDKRIVAKTIIILSVTLNLILLSFFGVRYIRAHVLNTNTSGGEHILNTQYNPAVDLFSRSTLIDAEVVMQGDSIIQRCNWYEFFPGYSIANRGIGSDTSEGIVNRISQCTGLSPRSTFIMIGINDIAYSIPLSDIS
ncbi:hypothetical protein AGMMS49992_18930 [Clostridia bacterium]|nr:hypothetical protein AGMMS49992_18930 [Clostridia bacterium]